MLEVFDNSIRSRAKIDSYFQIFSCFDSGDRVIGVSIQMDRAAQEKGVTKILVTTHHSQPQYQNQKSTVLEMVQNLNAVLVSEGISLEILKGKNVEFPGKYSKIIKMGKPFRLIKTIYIFLPNFSLIMFRVIRNDSFLICRYQD